MSRMFRVVVTPKNAYPHDDGLNFVVEVPARDLLHALRRIFRYMDVHVVAPVPSRATRKKVQAIQ